MYCGKCGFNVQDGFKFCPKCGNEVVGAGTKIIKLTCDDCGGTMSVNGDQNLIVCPFCGSKRIVIESDTVKVEQIRSGASVEKQRIQSNEEMYKAKVEADKTKSETKSTIALLITCFGFMFLMLLLLNFIR